MLLPDECFEAEWCIYVLVNKAIIGSDKGIWVFVAKQNLNQCWLIVSWNPGNKLQWNLKISVKIGDYFVLKSMY